MKLVLGVIFLIAVALGGSRWSFSRIRLPFFARHFYFSGTEFILVGVFIGPSFINLLDYKTLTDLHPLLSVILGWIGLLFGLQLDIKLLKGLPRQFFRISILFPVLILCFMLPPLYFMIKSTVGASAVNTFLASLVLAATASCTAQSSLAMFQKELKLHRNAFLWFLRIVSSLDAIPAIVVCGFLACFVAEEPVFHASFLPETVQWFIFITFLSIVIGILMKFLLMDRLHHSELLVFTIGFVAFIGGIASYFRNSILFMTSLIGMILTNKANVKRLTAMMVTLEKPAYIVMLIMAGALAKFNTPWNIALIAVYCTTRFAGKFISGKIVASLLTKPSRVPGYFGLGLISEGGISLALALSYLAIQPGPLADVILITVLIAIAVNEIAASFIVPGVVRSHR